MAQIDLTKQKVLKLNGDKTYRVLYHDSVITSEEFKVRIPYTLETLGTLLEDFAEINKIEIYASDGTTLLCASSAFSKLKDWSTANSIYYTKEGEHILAITLTLCSDNSNLKKEVAKLKEQVNPTIDYDSMDIEEYCKVYTDRFGEQCMKTIFAGVDVETIHGTEHFSATTEDQQNIKALCDIAIATKIDLPYHADKTQCKIYTAEDIIKIYASIQALVLYQTTYCNAVNTYIRSLTEKTDIASFIYGQTIPNENIVNEMNEALAQGQKVINTLTTQYLTTEEAAPDEDPVSDEDTTASQPENESSVEEV